MNLDLVFVGSYELIGHFKKVLVMISTGTLNSIINVVCNVKGGMIFLVNSPSV